ncbi:MAG: ribosomal RNA small subunit methyltransferase I, partial [Burkholderiales bacterium]|nr:ribosomal RNA small subunit methyltransferase I [Burkholderiales bacterium]
HAAGIRVVPLPGPSALLLALAASGLDGQNFAFVGYLPQPAAERRARILELQAASRRTRQTQLFIEAPYRNVALLQALLETLDARTRLSVSCGLTLPDGWSLGATVARWRERPAALPDDRPAVFALSA